MRRIASTPRADIVQVADELGFPLLECDGKPYWDETAYYSFSLRQIEDDLEDPTAELHALILETVAHVVSDEATLRRLGFPPIPGTGLRTVGAAGPLALWPHGSGL